PVVGHCCSQFNLHHMVTENFGASNFFTETITYDALVTDSFVFTAVAVPVAGWTEDAFTKQPVFFWFQGAIVNSFRFFDLTIGPLANLVGGGQSDAHEAE